MYNGVMSDGRIINKNYPFLPNKMDEWVGGWVWKEPHDSSHLIYVGNLTIHKCVYIHIDVLKYQYDFGWT
jgi:hypothetical protein